MSSDPFVWLAALIPFALLGGFALVATFGSLVRDALRRWIVGAQHEPTVILPRARRRI
jgi:hypothetical protein